MPKVIENIKENIIDTALELFSEYGYANIEMKTIAKNAGIAVGTLYNYFPNKNQLFMDIFIKSWEDTITKLEKIVDEHEKPLIKMKQFIYTLYDEIEIKKGLGKELIKANVIKANVMGLDNKQQRVEYKNRMINMMIKILKEIRCIYGLQFEMSMDKRMSEVILLTVFQNVMLYPEEKEKNKEFIIRIIECIIGRKLDEK